MKIILNLIIFLLIGCYSSNQKKKTSEATDLNKDYNIQNVLIDTRDGAKISAIIVRKSKTTESLPVILESTIYVRDKGLDLMTLKESVDKGYFGVIAYARGKHLSPNQIWPYENDANDIYDVIDWISKQKWCDGRVGMFEQ